MRIVTAAAVGIVAATTLAACGSGSAGGSGGTAVSSDCKAAHSFDTVKKGTLTVAFYDLPPFTKNEAGKISGVDGDLLAKIAAKECLTITPMPLAAAAVIPAVQTGRADVAAAAWYRTKARSEIVALPNPIYLDQQAFVSKDGVKQYSQLTGRKVGTVDGYMWVSDAKKVLGGALQVYNSTLNMNQDLKAGRIEVGIDSYGSGVFNNPDMKVEVVEADPRIAGSAESAQATFPVTKSNTKLLEALNADIDELKSSGEVAKILQDHKLPASAADTGAGRLL